MVDKIESEQKRKRLTEIIERWANHTKSSWMLREGDVPSLVDQIIEEFYHVQLSCGHWVEGLDEGVWIEWEDSFCDEDGAKKGMVSGTYCKVCAEEYKRDLGAKEIKG